MNVCQNCGSENFNSNKHCFVCGEPIDPALKDESHDNPLNLFTYETDQSYFMTKLYPVAFLAVLIIICLPIVFIPIPTSFQVLWFMAVLFMVVMAFSYYWLFPSITIQEDQIKLTTIFNEYWIKAEQIKNIVDIDMMFMPKRLRVDLDKGPVFYRLNGFLFGAWGKPMFLINKDINNFDLLYQVLIDITGIKPKKVII